MNFNMTLKEASTMASPPSENASVMSPQRSAKAGRAVPMPKAAIVPTAMRT